MLVDRETFLLTMVSLGTRGKKDEKEWRSLGLRRER